MSKNLDLEKTFQSSLISELQDRFPNCFILVTNQRCPQGFPDLIVLWNAHWAMLECKRSATAIHQPNQDYYIELFDKMSFAAFIYPENKKEVLDALAIAFGD